MDVRQTDRHTELKEQWEVNAVQALRILDMEDHHTQLQSQHKQAWSDYKAIRSECARFQVEITLHLGYSENISGSIYKRTQFPLQTDVARRLGCTNRGVASCSKGCQQQADAGHEWEQQQSKGAKENFGTLWLVGTLRLAGMFLVAGVSLYVCCFGRP